MIRNYLKLSQNIIWGQLSRHPGSAPLKVGFEITYRCHSRCRQCSRWQIDPKRREAELNTREIKDIIDQIAAFPIPGISFSGGEPLLHDDFGEIVEYSKQSGIQLLSLSTNGHRLADDNIRKLLLENFNRVHISIDGLSATHDRLRGLPGSFDRVVAAVELLVAERAGAVSPDIIINFTISPDNYREIVAVAQLAQRIGADHLNFQPVHQIASANLGRAEPGALDLAKLRQEIETALTCYPALLANQAEYYRLIPAFFADQKAFKKIRCWAGVASLRIDPYGNVYPCQSLPPVGSLRRRPLRDLLRSPRFKAQLHQIHRGNHPLCWLGCYAPLNLAIKHAWNPRRALSFLAKYQT